MIILGKSSSADFTTYNAPAYWASGYSDSNIQWVSGSFDYSNCFGFGFGNTSSGSAYIYHYYCDGVQGDGYPNIKNPIIPLFYKYNNVSYPVKGISGFYHFANATTESIYIPNSITSIESSAFSINYAPNLTNVFVDNVSTAISGSPWGATGVTITYLKTS